MMKRLTLDDQLCYALYATTNAVTRAYRPLLDDIGLTYPQYLVMLALWQDGPRTVGGIADRLALPQNAVGQIVKRLTEKGYVTRGRATDRRQLRIAVTETGEALERKAAEAQEKVVCATALDPDELARLRTDLAALATRMEARRKDPAACDLVSLPQQ